MLKYPHKNLLPTIKTAGESNADKDLNPPQETASQKAFGILHVEDDLTVAGLVQEIAEEETWKVEHRIEGNAALEELASDTDYDLLLVDHELPGVNGLELIEHVRGMFHRRYMPIVMMSGTLDEAAALEAGADAFLRKPQGIGLLAETISRLLREREQEGEGT
jgi:DNA-binding response OmpR family regulator